MKALPRTPELLRVARRVVWFEEPERALADPLQFLAHVMVFGTVEDLKALRGIVGKHEYHEVLEQAPPGIFDARSWAYWNLVCGRNPAPPLPVRAGLQPIRGRRRGKPAVSLGVHLRAVIGGVAEPAPARPGRAGSIPDRSAARAVGAILTS
jgi:hypothetical protein